MGERATRWADLRWLGAGVVLAVLSVVAGVLAAWHATFPGDEAVSAAVRGLGGAFEPVAYSFNALDTVIMVIVVSGTVAGLLHRRRLDLALAVAVLMVLRPLLHLAKALVDRPRPAGEFEVLDIVSDSSFPSGHVMTAVVVWAPLFLWAGVLLPPRLVRPVWAVAVGAVLLTALSRMWAGVHWFSDTWGGVLWALTLVAFVAAFHPTWRRMARVLQPFSARGS